MSLCRASVSPIRQAFRAICSNKAKISRLMRTSGGRAAETAGIESRFRQLSVCRPQVVASQPIHPDPIHFVQQLTRTNRLQVAFDALVLSEAIDERSAWVRSFTGTTAPLRSGSRPAGTVRKLTGRCRVVGGASPPTSYSSASNECEFQARCRQKA